jgi:hypothetical protein
MFHSTGMPLGLLIPMKPWKLTTTNSISPVTSGEMLAASTNGIAHSVSVPMRAMNTANWPGRRSSG